MNKERVRELYDLARLQAGQEKNFAATVEDVYLKFAETLVVECIQICIEEGRTYEVESAGEYSSNLYAAAIKKHFEIE